MDKFEIESIKETMRAETDIIRNNENFIFASYALYKVLREQPDNNSFDSFDAALKKWIFDAVAEANGGKWDKFDEYEDYRVCLRWLAAGYARRAKALDEISNA